MERTEKIDAIIEELDKDHELVSYELYREVECDNSFDEMWTADEGSMDEYLKQVAQENMGLLVNIIKSDDFVYENAYYKIDAYGYVKTCNSPDFFIALSDDRLLECAAEKILDRDYEVCNDEIEEIIDEEEED